MAKVQATTATPQKKPTEHGASTDRKRKALSVLLRVGIVILLLIPSYIAIAHYVVRKNNPIVIPETLYTSVVCECPGGKELSAVQGDDKTTDTRLLAIFERLLTGATRVDSLPTGLSPAYRVSMGANTGTEYYAFYFSTQDGTCYFTNAAGEPFFATPVSAEAFLNSPFAFDLYPQATPPVLTTAATDEIIPSQLSWHYRTQNGTFTELTSKVTTMEILTYPIANDIDFDFSTLPDSHEVVIRRGGEVYRGNIEGIPHLSLEKDELLDFEISASYNPGSNTSYYGTVTYRFRMRVVEAAKFRLDRLSATMGDYVLLSCQNVKNAQKLEIAGEPALPAAPVIFKRGETVYAMIPTLQTGTQQITVTYGSISDTFALSVTPNASATEHVYTSEQLRNWPSELLQELNRRIEEHGALTDNGQPLFGHFEAYDASVAERILAFGDTLTVNGASPVTVPFELYKMSTEHHVTALSYGVVREVGEDAVFGQYVIIDHGGGLYSHYYGLTAIQVQQQQSVGGGDELGLASTTGIGLAGERNVLILTTLGKTAISPDFLRTHGLDLE